MKKHELTYEKLEKLVQKMKYLLFDASDTINSLGYDLAKNGEKPCLYCWNCRLDKCFDCNFRWDGDSELDKIINELEPKQEGENDK